MPADRNVPLAVVGNLNVDLWVRTVERFPRWDEELVVDSSRLELAGTAGYVIRACQGLGLASFAVSTIGDDAFGSFIQVEMRALDLPTEGVEVLPGHESCLGLIFVGAGGERAILATLGAHAAMDVAVAWRHDDRVAGCAEVLLCGAYLLPRFGPAVMQPYATALRARGQLVAFDPSWDPGGWTDDTREATRDLLCSVDIYLPNEIELCHLTGAPNLDAALDEIVALTGEIVVKRGANGAIYASGAERISAPGFAVDAVNTVGAGDVFDVGYLYARRHGLAPGDRLRFAGALAAMVVAQPGARVYPDAAAVERFMGEAAGGDRRDA